MSAVHIAGAGMVRFGKFDPSVTFEMMAVNAAKAAMQDAGAERSDIQAVYVGHVFGGPVAGQRTAVELGLGGLPVSNHENYCASGATALREAWMAIRAGEYDVTLVIGAEKMTDRIKGGVTPDPSDLDAMQGFVMTAGHALSARRYMADYGATREQIAMVAVKNHAHSQHNPYAQYQKAVSLEEVLSARLVADPLGVLDCSPISDGAAAVIVCSDAGLARLATSGRRPKLRGIGLTSGTLRSGLYDLNEEDISSRAAVIAFEKAGIDPSDIDFVEMHDCFTIAEIVRMEGIGLIPRGEGAAWTERGDTSIGGRLPVNPSGGLLSRGHPVGATGVAQVCEMYWQLTGQARARQVEGARMGLSYCKGGTVSGTDGGSVSTVVMEA